MSDVDHNSVYHRKMALLQEKLRKSEEERLKLEEKFSVMMQACKEEEEERLSHLKLQYENFLEEDRKRRDRNDSIMRSLDRIESRAATLNAKSKRLKLLREHYEAYLKRVYPSWKNKSPVTTSTRNSHTGYSPVSNFDQHIESSYAECFTTPFAANRRSSVSLSDNLTSPRLMDIAYSPRNYDDIMSPSSFTRYQQHTLDREVTGGKSKFPPNVYQKAIVKNGLEYDRGPGSYVRGMNTEFNNIGTLNNSRKVINGYSEFAGHSADTNSDILLTTDTQKYPSAYENRVQNLSDGKTEIQSPHGKLGLPRENNIIGTVARSATLEDCGKEDLNPVSKRESKDLAAGMSADIEWEQNTSRDLLNMSLTDDGKISNGPCKTEQLMKHHQNLHMLKRQMEDLKTPVTEGNYGDNHFLNKDFLESNVQKQGKETLTSDYNKQEEMRPIFPHETYEQNGHTETDKLNGISSVDNSVDNISIEIGKSIERALSSERETIRPSDSPEKQRNLDIIVEEANSTEEMQSQIKSIPEKSYDSSANDTEPLSGAILIEGDDELQYNLSNEAGLDESSQQQIMLEEKPVHDTALPIKGEQITSELIPQSGDFAREDYNTNFEGNSSEGIKENYESNIQNVDDSVMYLQQQQNAYETTPTYPENIGEMAYDNYNNQTVNAQVDGQYLQETPKQDHLAEPYDVQAAQFDSELQQESGIIFDNTQDQNYIYETVQNAQEDYSPGGEASENFYVETYESSDPNFGQQLQPNTVVPDQNWEPYNEITFQNVSGPNTVQSTYQNFEIQQNMDTQNLQPGEFIYNQEIPGSESQYYMNNVEQRGPYTENLGQDQYFYGNDVQPGDVQIQDDVSGHQIDYATNDTVSAQKMYQQPDEGASGFSPQHNQEPNHVMDKTDNGAAISHNNLFDENKVPDISVQQSSEHTENLHVVASESYGRPDDNSEMQRQVSEKQNSRNSESDPNTAQDSVHLNKYFETESSSINGKFYQDPEGMGTDLAHNETTKNKTEFGINIEQSPSTTEVEEVAAGKENNTVQGDGRHLEVLDTISENVKDETHHTNNSNSSKDDSTNEQYKDISRHKDVVESDITTKSEDKILNSGDKIEQTETSNKEPSGLEPTKSVISGEEEYTESFDGGKYHEPTVAYESGIPGYSNAADSSTTEDSSERWTTMPKKTRQQMTLKVQNKKAESTLPPDEDSSDESGQMQPELHGSQARATPHAETSKDSEQLDNRMATEAQHTAPLGEQKEPTHTGGTTTAKTEIKLGRLPARGSSKLPTVSTVIDSDNDSLHLGSESSMT